MNLEFWLEALVASLLLVTAGYCFVLNRRLGVLRSSQNEMQRLLDEFVTATSKAERSIETLKRASAEAGNALQERVGAARELADELSMIVQTGSSLADRLEERLLSSSASPRSLDQLRNLIVPSPCCRSFEPTRVSTRKFRQSPPAPVELEGIEVEVDAYQRISESLGIRLGDLGKRLICKDLLTTKLLCSTYLKIKEVFLLKPLKFKCLKNTGDTTEVHTCTKGSTCLPDATLKYMDMHTSDMYNVCSSLLTS